MIVLSNTPTQSKRKADICCLPCAWNK